MFKITVRQGETFQLPVTIDDTSAETVELSVWDDDGEVLNESATFVDGEATIDGGIVAIEVGVYNCSITVTYSDGVVDILPDASECGETECEFPEFEVCEGGPETS